MYANSDHIHILCTLPRTITITMLISKIKTSSSKWLKQKGLDTLHWQDACLQKAVMSFT
ncbi:MAG: transposase [Salinivirgaceae bacterium]|nr:transposase [Salinivirgaceae bacterium]